MGGGYAKIAEPLQRDADGNPQYTDRGGNSGGGGGGGGEGGGGGGGGGGVLRDDDDHTPRTENEELAKQAELSKSPHAAGPPSAGLGNAKKSKYASMKIKWADQTMGGPPLAEPFYSDKLHYSVLYS